ncbi:unnamed protein product [Paramecium primaurelia]|uniref:P-loop containing nucleoside triphosphate hydrolase n=2 Tax=Paramecium TaxID=5884 RepID=A0A8S1TLH6_9CILI|nr:unnamed protein product [Paramecium primaurelia]CAD8154881.1 unnamed protein product [Paramecium pentaurelia]
MSLTKEIKVVLLGDSGVGKSSLLYRFVENDFQEKGQPTLGAAFQSKTILIDGKALKFQIWDTAGQEKYKAILPLYYRDAKVALLVYDVNDKQSFEGVKEWFKQLQEQGPLDQIRVIIGNKCDLEQNVSDENGKELAKQYNAIYFKTSCKDNIGVQETFVQVGEKVFKEQLVEESRKSNTENANSTLKIGSQNQNNKQQQNKRFCC